MKYTLSVLILATMTILGLLGQAALAGAIAPDQITNGTFDDNLNGWTLDVVPASWSNSDARGLSSSGSARQTIGNSPGTPYGLLQCLPVVNPGQPHTLSADVFVDSAATAFDLAYIGMIFLSDTDCGLSGGAIVGSGSSPANEGLRNQWHRQSVTVLAPQNARSILVSLLLLSGSADPWDGYFDNVDLSTGSCAASDTALCLSGGRFQVEATWRKQNGDTGVARVQNLTDETGYLWFFNADNVEVIVKVKDACASSFNRFWVFASGLTNVEVSLRVTDTLTGLEWTRITPLGQPFPPILDTDAFDTCPL